MNAFVEADPWFAGWCGVMVNLSDILDMGGRPTNLRADRLQLAVSIIGRAKRLNSSFTARSSDTLVAAIDHRGSFR